MKPIIEIFPETKLVGKRVKMSFVENKTTELWQEFMPNKVKITNGIGPELYSVEIYDDPDFFKNFNPNTIFEKWAAVEVADFDSVPDVMETLVIPEGIYAVFFL